MSNDLKDIPAEELERIINQSKKNNFYRSESQRSAFDAGYKWGASQEYLRHLSPFSKPEIGPRWVKASERPSDVIHDVTMRLVGQVRTWFGTLEIQIGKVVGPHGNIFDPRTVEYLDESIPSSEPAKESQPDGFLEWLDEEIATQTKVILKTTNEDVEVQTQYHHDALSQAREKYLSLHAQPKHEPSEENHILKLSEWLNRELVWQESHAKSTKAQFHKGALQAFEAVAAKILSLTNVSPPSVKPEREETASGLPSPLLDWVDAEDDLPSDQNEEYHLRYRTSDGWAADCNMVYLSLKEFPGLQWLKETASPLLLAALDKMASSQPSPSALGGQVAASFYCMYNKLTGDCAVQCGHCKSLSSQPSPASPAVQQEDGEVPEEVSQWIVHRSFTSFSHGQPFQQCVGALKDMYHKMQEEIEIRGHQINDLREENKDLQSRLTASRYVTDKTMAQLSEKETEAADYRNALIKIEILGTAVESPGVFESGRGWEATKNKYAEIAWAARVKYIQQTPTK